MFLIKDIKLQNFRSYSFKDLKTDHHVICIVGPNGSGKTNILEAISLVLDLMKTKGICTWNTMPYSDQNGCSTIPTVAQDVEAANYKITTSSKIINSDKLAIKTALYNKHAVMTGVTIDNGFLNAGPGYVWRSNSGSGAYSHGLTICGWDDSKNAYKVINSFGTSWGDAGYSWIDYNYFPIVASYYGYIID